MHELISLPSEYQMPLPDVSEGLTNEEILQRFKGNIERLLESIENPEIKASQEPILVLWYDQHLEPEEREPVGLVRSLNSYVVHQYDRAGFEMSAALLRITMEEYGFDGSFCSRGPGKIIPPYQAESTTFRSNNLYMFFERTSVSFLGNSVYDSWSAKFMKREPKSAVRRLIDKIPNIR